MTEPTNDAPVSTSTDRASGVLLVMASAVAIVFMAMHPSPHSHELGAFVKDFAENANFNLVVHSVLMGATATLFLGLVGFARQLCLGTMLARSGLVMAALGTISLLAAATVNGIIVSRLVLKYADTTVPTLESLRPLLVLTTEANHACDHLGIVFQSASLVLWSIALVRRTGGTRTIGMLGLLVGVGAPALLFAGRLPMTVHGFGAFMLATTIWYIAIGVQMIRGRI
ncbi:MAG: hypothetical protein ACREJD_05460 [Phycisphaerales bacterium]